MAYWTVAGDPKNDAARARETRAHFAKTNWADEMKKIEAEKYKGKTDRRSIRMLEQLRRDWKSAAGMRDYVATGVAYY